MAPPVTTAVIIGGGVVGMTIALRLQRSGVAASVTVVDPDAQPRPASWGNAGHIACEQVVPFASTVMIAKALRGWIGRDSALALPWRDLPTWAPFIARLLAAALPARHAAGTGALTALMAQAMPAWQRLAADLEAPGLLRQNGHLIVWDTPRSAAAGRRAWLSTPTGSATFGEAHAADRRSVTALLGHAPAGLLRCSGSGQITDPDVLHAALRHRFAVDGGKLLFDRAAELRVDGAGRCSIELQTGGLLQPDLVVVAAGVWSRTLLERLGHRVPLVAERGYHLQAAGAAWPADLPPVVFEDHALIVTRFAHGVRASSTTEFTATDRPADAGQWQRLRRHIDALGLPFETASASAWMGARPTLPDYLPAIGRSRRAANLLYAFGHQHLGLTLAPVTAEALAALAAEDRHLADAAASSRLAAFDIDRFR